MSDTLQNKENWELGAQQLAEANPHARAGKLFLMRAAAQNISGYAMEAKLGHRNLKEKEQATKSLQYLQGLLEYSTEWLTSVDNLCESASPKLLTLAVTDVVSLEPPHWEQIQHAANMLALLADKIEEVVRQRATNAACKELELLGDDVLVLCDLKISTLRAA